jgi:iron complex outermembrane receptor protein
VKHINYQLWLVAAGIGFGLAASPAVQAADSAEAAVTLEEVVITAERREASAQRSAIAITVVGGDELTMRGIQSARDLLDAVPGLDLTQASPSANFSLRGLGAGGGTNFTDGVVGFNNGGVPIARPWATTGSMYDLERVEVLKGPQGTLYGRNATVGAINLIPRRPGKELGGNANLTIGNYNTANFSGAINLPISSSLSFRLAASNNKHTGYLSNGYNDANNQGTRASLLIEPNENFSALLRVDWFREDSRGPSTVNRYMIAGQEFQFPDNPWFAFAPAGCGDPYQCPIWSQSAGPGFSAVFGPNSVVDTNGYFRLTQLIYSAQIDWKFGGATLTLLPAVVTTNNNFLNYTSGFNFKNITKVDQQSFEVRIASNTDGRFKWLAGAIYYKEDQNADQRNFEPRGYQIIRTPSMLDKSTAVFGEATFSVSDKFRVTGGVRVSHETKSQDGFTLLEFASPAAPSFTAANCLSPGVLVVGATSAFGETYPAGYCQVPNAGSASFNNTSYKIGVEWDVAPDSLLYANVRTGFKAGGFFPGLPPNTYKPEELTAYEIGSKNRFFNNRLQANLEVFYWDYKDQQIGLLANINPAGQSTRPINVPGYAKGVELDLEWLFSDHDRLKLLLLNESGKYDLPAINNTTNAVTTAVADFPRINMPKWNGTLDYSHIFAMDNGATLTPAIRMHTETGSNLRPVAAALQTPGDLRSGFNSYNADLTWEPGDKKWTATLYIDNLTNVAVAGTGTSGGVSLPIWYRPAAPYNTAGVRYSTISPPRTYGVRVSANF